jgi:hypothetical protein
MVGCCFPRGSVAFWPYFSDSRCARIAMVTRVGFAADRTRDQGQP